MQVALKKAEPPKIHRGGGRSGSMWDDVIAELVTDENLGEWFVVATDVTRPKQAHFSSVARNLGWKAHTRLIPSDDTFDRPEVDADGNETGNTLEGTGLFAEMFVKISMSLEDWEAQKAAKGTKGDDTDGDDGDEDGGTETEAEAEVAEVPQTAAQKAKARAAAKKANAAK